MSNLYRGLSIEASYQVWFHFSKWFQRRRFFKKSTNQKQELPLAVISQPTEPLGLCYHTYYIVHFVLELYSDMLFTVNIYFCVYFEVFVDLKNFVQIVCLFTSFVF
jgi:hypothetical protein